LVLLLIKGTLGGEKYWDNDVISLIFHLKIALLGCFKEKSLIGWCKTEM
jgi:hypothetical protein